MSILQELEWRGLLHGVTHRERLADRLEQGPTRLYCGFDPTADSLHVGNLLALVTLERFRRAGHAPYVVLGTATAAIGDPSGRDRERPVQDPATLARNGDRIREQVLRLFTDQATPILSNGEWGGDLDLLTFLRDTGKHFKVNQMM